MSVLINEEIERSGGWINFERYMQMALFTPRLGYYAGDRSIFGVEGDYVTAPEIGSLFTSCLAEQIVEALDAAGNRARKSSMDILEFGAGNGELASTLLDLLAREDKLPGRYMILETSAALQSRQVEVIAKLPKRIQQRVHWIDSLPETICGVVLANEVLDAMPVQKFRIDDTGSAVPLGVTVSEAGYSWQMAPEDRGSERDVAGLVGDLDLPVGYQSESSRLIPAWIRSVADRLTTGLLLLVDYGYDRRTYYHPERSMGTLMCHYRHHAHGDPFLWPGLQDITAHVDFTLVAESAQREGLDVLGYSDQAGYLLEAGLPEIYPKRLAAAGIGSPAGMALAAEARRLTMPQEMGEQFKVIALGRNMPRPTAFSRRNLVPRLHA